jgi:hypothetical protein
MIHYLTEKVTLPSRLRKLQKIYIGRMAEGKQQFRFLRDESAAQPTPLLQLLHVAKSAKSLKVELAVSARADRAYTKAPGIAVPALAIAFNSMRLQP